MKKYYRFALMAVLTVGLSLAVTSCKDDDKESKTSEEQAEEQASIEADNANTFWGVAANLVSPFDVTADYEDKTFEPTIGVAQNGNSTIRVVSTGNMSAAAKRFADLTGAEIDENTASYTYQNDAVGTLTYTKTNDGTSLAKVDVSIKQIPHLQQIVYKTPEQMGENGHFEGAAYYSFGDVISLLNDDGEKEYWVCVRPALGIAGKEKSHWVTLSPLPEKNVWTYQGKKKPITFKLPQALGTNYEQMQNLAELLYAICNPEKWWQNLQDNKGIDLFHDLNHDRARYFNQYFWQIVQNYWKDDSNGVSVFNRLFGCNFEDMKKIINDQNALHLLYYGFSWRTMTSNSPTLYEYTYSNGAGKKSNMHDKKYKAVSKNVMTGDGIELNCVNDYTTNRWVCPAFFGDEQPRFIFRFAKGRDLFGSEPNVFQSMRGGKHNIDDVYVLNQKLGIAAMSNLKVFTEADLTPGNVVKNKAADDKMGVYVPGDVVKDEQNKLWFCIAGSGYNEKSKPAVLDDRAWFISFEGITMGNRIPTNILTEAQAPEVGIRILKFLDLISGYKFLGRDNLGPIAQHVFDYAKVNAADLGIRRDSVWRFKDNKTMNYYDSSSQSYFTNIAYIGDDGQLKLLRCIYDLTQAGNNRGMCNPASGNHKDWENHHFRMYKHYQNGDPNSWSPLTDDERSLEMTRYLTTWPMTNDWMLFSDLGNQTKVDQWAAKDKWVTLPLTNLADPKELSTKREQPRKRAYSNLRANSFVMTDNGTFYDHLGMYNEPVLFVRVMTVKDKGGNVATLESEDGRKLKVVHLQDNEYYYKGVVNWSDALTYTALIEFIDLDNEHYNMDIRFGN